LVEFNLFVLDIRANKLDRFEGKAKREQEKQRHFLGQILNERLDFAEFGCGNTPPSTCAPEGRAS
jgi:hypothetical protein